MENEVYKRMIVPDIRIYTSDMELIGFSSDVTSLQWTRKYNEPGDFELHMALSEDNINYIKKECIVWLFGAKEAGVIERIEKSVGDEPELVASGRFLSSYLDRRLIRPFYSINNGLVETAMREIYTKAVAIPRVSLGDRIGITDKITFQATYKNLLAYEEKLAAYAGIGFRFRPDFSARSITFELYKGVDRSIAQSDRARVIFADEFANLSSAEYVYSSEDYKNVCYVGGKGEGSARTFVTVGDDALSGLDRREYFLSATDVESDNQTDAQYKAALKQRGTDKLEELAESVSLTAKISPDGNYKYKTDYDLGDIVTITVPNLGISMNERITEVKEIYERDGYQIELTVGTPTADTIDFDDD